MKLYTASISSYRSKPETLLIEGNTEEIVDFINSVGDGNKVWSTGEKLLGDSGGYYYSTPTDYVEGFESLYEALMAYVEEDEKVMIKD